MLNFTWRDLLLNNLYSQHHSELRNTSLGYFLFQIGGS